MIAVGCVDFVRKPLYDAEIFRKMTDYLRVQFELKKSGVSHHRATQADSANPSLEAIQKLPQAWRWHFHQASIQAYSDWLRSLMAELPEEQYRLKQGLYRLNAQLDFETIMALTETVACD